MTEAAVTGAGPNSSGTGRTERTTPAMRAAAAAIRTAFDPMALCSRDGTPLVGNRGYDELLRVLGSDTLAAIAARAIDDMDGAGPADDATAVGPESIRCQAGEIDVESIYPMYVVALHRNEAANEPALSRAAAREVQHNLRQALHVLSTDLGADDDDRTGPLNALTTKEEEVLGALVAGYRVPTIARDLHVSQSTVRSHLRSIFQKYGVHSQAALIEKLLTSDRNSGG